ncbi:putative PGG domain-containing protein [Medicago truncatula]|uniref:Putative PGG domain-containing protein n=1 Tax=Medicago truncatula TaxID=3880 RepID=A0A396GKU8_MEDTR|nr:putative PGG domain-containing protein [Medicago truncatula]
MNNEVENHGGSTETAPNKESKKGWRKVLEKIRSWLSYKDRDKWLEDMRGNLGLIATVIATMTFQMILNPPGGVMSIKDGENPPSTDASPPSTNANPPNADNYDKICTFVYKERLCPGEAVLAVRDSSGYLRFLISNTICFIASVSVCLLLVSGIPMHHRFLMWLLSLGMWVTLTSLAYSYLTAAIMTTPDRVYFEATEVVNKVFFTWIGLSAFIGLCHTLRLVTWGVIVLLERNKKPKSTKETPIC